MVIKFITTQLQEAPEEGTASVTVSFFDDTGAAVVPTSATWTLTNEHGTVVNSRSAIPITGLAVSKTIAITNDDLDITTYGIHRRLLVEYLYNSSLGSGLRGKSETRFNISNFTAVT